MKKYQFLIILCNVMTLIKLPGNYFLTYRTALEALNLELLPSDFPNLHLEMLRSCGPVESFVFFVFVFSVSFIHCCY